MGRSVLIALMGLVLSGKGFATAVYDATASARLGSVLKTGAQQLGALKGLASTAGETLNTVKGAFYELETLNAVMGSPLSNKLLKRLSQFSGLSSRYGGFLQEVGSDNGNMLESLHDFSRHQFGTRNYGHLFRAKRYIQNRYFPERSSTLNVERAGEIRFVRERALEDSLITSMSVSKHYKEELQKDHEDLLQISRDASASGEMNHQVLHQTKILMRIAQNQEKMIHLLSEQTSLISQIYMDLKGVGLGDLSKQKVRSR